MRVLLAVVFVTLTWQWGDWRNWRRYESTILFFIVGALLYDVLLYNYPMWEYATDKVLPNHTWSAVVLDFVVFPCTVLLYIPHYPKTRLRQVSYVVMWGVIYSLIEWGMLRLKLLSYHNGWTYLSSSLFDFGMFAILAIHYKRPLLAYVISLFSVVFLMLGYHVPTSAMK